MRACVGGVGGGGGKGEEKLRTSFTFLITVPQAEENIGDERTSFVALLDVRGWLSRGSAACYLFN